MDRGFWPLREMSPWLWRERHRGVSEGKGPALGRGRGLAVAGPGGPAGAQADGGGVRGQLCVLEGALATYPRAHPFSLIQRFTVPGSDFVLGCILSHGMLVSVHVICDCKCTPTFVKSCPPLLSELDG